MHWLPWWAYPAACCALAGGACGWVLGYAHRELVEWGRRCARLLAWRRKHRPVARAYRELWRDAVHLCATGELRPGR